MKRLFFAVVLLLFFPGVLPAGNSPVSPPAAAHLEHSPQKAQELFRKKCTGCHSAARALSRRTYLDWKDGIAYRHGKPDSWLSDDDARNLFLHLVVHLEPEVKEAALSQAGDSKTNWRFILTIAIGTLAYVSLLITFLIGSVKPLRRRFFRRHRRWAFFAIGIASVHALYVLYFFFLK